MMPERGRMNDAWEGESQGGNELSIRVDREAVGREWSRRGGTGGNWWIPIKLITGG